MLDLTSWLKVNAVLIQLQPILLINFLKWRRWNGFGWGDVSQPYLKWFLNSPWKKIDGVEIIIGEFPAFFLFNFLFSSCFLFIEFCDFTLSSMSKLEPVLDTLYNNFCTWLGLMVLKMEPTTFVQKEINSKCSLRCRNWMFEVGQEEWVLRDSHSIENPYFPPIS